MPDPKRDHNFDNRPYSNCIGINTNSGNHTKNKNNRNATSQNKFQAWRGGLGGFYGPWLSNDQPQCPEHPRKNEACLECLGFRGFG